MLEIFLIVVLLQIGILSLFQCQHISCLQERIGIHCQECGYCVKYISKTFQLWYWSQRHRSKATSTIIEVKWYLGSCCSEWEAWSPWARQDGRIHTKSMDKTGIPHSSKSGVGKSEYYLYKKTNWHILWHTLLLIQIYCYGKPGCRKKKSCYKELNAIKFFLCKKKLYRYR